MRTDSTSPPGHETATTLGRVVSFVWAAILLIWTIVVGYIGLVGADLYLGDNPCALGDNPCEGTTALRIIGLVFVPFALATVITALLASMSYVIYGLRPNRRSWRLGARYLLASIVFAGAAVGVAFLGAALSDAFNFDLTIDRD